MNSASISVNWPKKASIFSGRVLTCRRNTVSPLFIADTNGDLFCVLVDGEVQHHWVLLGVKFGEPTGYAVIQHQENLLF